VWPQVDKKQTRQIWHCSFVKKEKTDSFQRRGRGERIYPTENHGPYGSSLFFFFWKVIKQKLGKNSCRAINNYELRKFFLSIFEKSE
jgi:hypothetical protein